MLAYPIEPKNATQLICEALRERFDAAFEPKSFSGLSPHEWHAQAVYIVKVLERTLGDSIGFHVLRGQYGTGAEAAASTRRVSEWLTPEAEQGSIEREVTDMLASHVLRGQPRLRRLSDTFDLPYSALQRPASAYRVLVGGVKRAALVRLDTRMRDAGLVTDFQSQELPTALDMVNQARQNNPRLVASLS
ncbi:Uncharacterised protein [Bordetella trematum]|uniref:Uncharacterized protein n=1 Tax=Bordetella trematum TaxID=123899 RepID=A0A157KW04_9BORD|nr:hypothetical protein [Bordetella trematum]SAH88554.1 Uncharacterised protein [Bordetella trematum]SAI66539.1 Uncharacterised protein [Bordetella trematum]SUV96559.1 Uncharacterised protein [Bordetella trematum]